MSELFKGEFSRRQILTTAKLGAISAAAIGTMGEEVAAQPTQQATPRGGSLPPQILKCDYFSSLRDAKGERDQGERECE